MAISELTAISPIDGRYRNKIEALSSYFSEFALIRFRVLVEIEYLIALSEIPLPQLKILGKNNHITLRKIYQDFSISDAARVKKIESKINHDVKAVEYFIKEKLDVLGLSKIREFVHFGLTSQDINNTAIPLAFSHCLNEFMLPILKSVEKSLRQKAVQWKKIAMLAHTHGQPASPTTLGKEIQVFIERLSGQLKSLKSLKTECKFGGATGNFNAHKIAFPQVNWIKFADNFTQKKLGLDRQHYTTQIEHYDNLVATFDALSRINTILIDFSRDIWLYISMGYFAQHINKSEVGSSAMPHKVNPINFENAEGNLGFANAILGHFSAKLPVSRLQRDLTDSTVIRNIGIPMAHSAIAWLAVMAGFNKLSVNTAKIKSDLDENWSVVSEAIQTILRREGFDNPYEMLKKATRTSKSADRAEIHGLIDRLNVSEKIKEELRKISPSNYTGYGLDDLAG